MTNKTEQAAQTVLGIVLVTLGITLLPDSFADTGWNVWATSVLAFLLILTGLGVLLRIILQHHADDDT